MRQARRGRLGAGHLYDFEIEDKHEDRFAAHEPFTTSIRAFALLLLVLVLDTGANGPPGPSGLKSNMSSIPGWTGEFHSDPSGL